MLDHKGRHREGRHRKGALTKNDCSYALWWWKNTLTKSDVKANKKGDNAHYSYGEGIFRRYNLLLERSLLALGLVGWLAGMGWWESIASWWAGFPIYFVVCLVVCILYLIRLAIFPSTIF